MQNESKSIRRFILRFNGFQGFFSLLPWVPIFYEYQKRVGLNDAQIFGIQSSYYLAFCFLEIPTGMIADRWGQLRCMRVGSGIQIVSSLFPIFFPNQWGLLTHFGLLALSRSLISGASSAYLYEYLKEKDALSHYKSAEGNARAISLIANVMCWAAVGPLMQWKLTSPYWMAVASALLAYGFAWSLPRQAPQAARKIAGPSRRLGADLGRVLGQLGQTPILLYIMAQGVAVFVLTRLCQINLFQPILGARGFPVVWYGVVLSGISLAEALGSAKPYWLSRRVSDTNSIFLLTSIMAVSLAAIAAFGSGPDSWITASKATQQVITLAALTVFSLATGFSFPIQRHRVNEVIPDSSYRATFLSLESILDRAVCAVVALQMGRFLGHGQLNQFLWWSAGGALVVTFALLAVKKNFINPLKHFDKVVGVH